MTALRRPLGGTGLSVSPLGFGTAGLGAPHVRQDLAAVDRMVGAYLDAGGNLFDAADSYNGGWSEAVLGRVLKGRRHEVLITSKVGMPVGPAPAEAGLAAAHIVSSLEGTLRRLGTDHVDLYYAHFYDAGVPMAETLEALGGLVRAGKVRSLGASSFHAWQLAEAAAIARELGLPAFGSVELKYSLLKRDVETELLPFCAWAGLGVLTFSPLQGGVLSGALRAGQTPAPGSRFADPWLRALYLGPDEARTFAVVDETARIAAELGATPAQVALAWVLRQPAVSAVLIGPESASEVEDNLAAAALELPIEAAARLDAVSRTARPYPADLYDNLDTTFAAMRQRAQASGPPAQAPQGETR
jgi:aryl-alcohol dehydrogenase-like predicted oxidoreductase